jgi:glycerol 2-dehydrogenase (NADP+)
VAYLRSKGIVPEAYSPLGSTGSPLLTDEVIVGVAEKHGLKAADVLLGWLGKHSSQPLRSFNLFPYLVAKDFIVLPKSVTPARITANLQGALAGASKLTKEDIEQLDGLAAAGKQKRFVTPPWRKLSSSYQFSRHTDVDV